MSGEIYEFGEFRLLPSARELWRGGKRVTLPRRTFECIEHLVTHRDRAVGRDELVAAVFGRPDVSDAQLGQIVLRARRALEDDGNAQRVIRTIAGFGYRWVADVRPAMIGMADGHQPASFPANHESGNVALPAARPDTHVPRRAVGLSHRHRWVFALVASVMAMGAITLHRASRTAAVPAPLAVESIPMPSASLAVLPLRVDALREDAWIRLGAMDLVADRLRQGGFAVPPSESVLALLETAPERAQQAQPDRVREATGAGLIVEGSARREAGIWHVELVAQPASGLGVPVRHSDRDAMSAMRGATDQLLAALGHHGPVDDEHDAPLEAILQRVRAAMLANELETARTILTEAPQLDGSPAVLRYQLAMVDLRGGQLARAEASLDELLLRPETKDHPLFQAQVLSARGSTRMRRGQFAESGRDFDAAIGLLAGRDHPLEHGRARMGRANSHVPEFRYDEALADFGVARTELESAGDILGMARVDANLGMLELHRGRPAAALDYLGLAVERFQSFGALHELQVSLTAVVDAQLALLRREDAASTVDRAWALRERISDPDQQADVLLNRAQVWIGEGRYQAAATVLDQARRTATSGNRVLLARQRSLDAELAWRRGDWQAAEAASATALAAWPEAGAAIERDAIILLRQRALLELGESAAAGRLLDRSRPPPTRIDEGQGRTAEAIAMAEWAHRSGDFATATRWFQHAMASADQRGVPAELAAVAQAWAPVLLRAEARQAAIVVGRVAPWAARDFDCALLQLRLLHANALREPWQNALKQARALAGERQIPKELTALDQPGREPPMRLTQTGR